MKPSYHDTEEFQNRTKKLEEIKSLGVEPYPHHFPPTHTAHALTTTYENDPVGNSEDAADAFKDSISAVFADAGEACDDGDSSDDVRTQFMADMKELRESAKASRGEYSFKDELSEARETRKAAMDAAKDTFLEGVAAAKETLRSAFAE